MVKIKDFLIHTFHELKLFLEFLCTEPVNLTETLPAGPGWPQLHHQCRHRHSHARPRCGGTGIIPFIHGEKVSW